MLKTIAEVTLRHGATMQVQLLEPPEEDYAQRLLDFLRHKDDDSIRGIRQRVLGQYADHCVDRYFVGEVDGRMVGHVWYGLPRIDDGRRWGIGNFGHVYTDPEWRGQGIAGELTRILLDDFNAEPAGSCMLCTAGEPAGRIYRRLGFEFIPPTADRGPMCYLKRSVAPDFATLDEQYFAPGLPTSILPGHIGHRHDIDRMMDFSAPWVAARGRWHLVGLSSHVPTFIGALHYVEDGRGLINVLRTDAGSVVGYAFVLNLGSPNEAGLPVLDLVLHPHYLDRGVDLVQQTLETAREAGDREVHAYVATCDGKKHQVLCDAGFIEGYRFVGAFGKADSKRHDIVLLRSGHAADPR
jgi:GNAT superfamily N-acetyltransferase